MKIKYYGAISIEEEKSFIKLRIFGDSLKFKRLENLYNLSFTDDNLDILEELNKEIENLSTIKKDRGKLLSGSNSFNSFINRKLLLHRINLIFDEILKRVQNDESI